MEHTAKDHSQIKGWGVDADPKNDPAYPMKHRNDGEQAGYSWERPQQQPLTVEVLHSNERADVTSVFGTSTPPSGPSGALRRLAFRYSESAEAKPERASIAEMDNEEKTETRHWSREAHTRYRKSWLATPPESASPPTSCAVPAARRDRRSGWRMRRRPPSARPRRW